MNTKPQRETLIANRESSLSTREVTFQHHKKLPQAKGQTQQGHQTHKSQHQNQPGKTKQSPHMGLDRISSIEKRSTSFKNHNIISFLDVYKLANKVCTSNYDPKLLLRLLSSLPNTFFLLRFHHCKTSFPSTRAVQLCFSSHLNSFHHSNDVPHQNQRNIFPKQLHCSRKFGERPCLFFLFNVLVLPFAFSSLHFRLIGSHRFQ